MFSTDIDSDLQCHQLHQALIVPGYSATSSFNCPWVFGIELIQEVQKQIKELDRK